jgi:hypothetical protein
MIFPCDARHVPRNTNSTATITMDMQKTPMPAITKPCFLVDFTAGGTSGIGIFRDFARSAMSYSQQQLQCQIQNAQAGAAK